VKRRVPAAFLLIALLAVLAAGLAAAETIQRGNVRVSFDGAITPRRLPRQGSAPVAVAVSTTIAGVKGQVPPQLRRISIAINRHGHLDAAGLPVCQVDEIQPATSEKALEACRASLVGRGTFSAQVALSRQSAFPSTGEMLAFNGSYEGKPAILAHVYGTEPVPTSLTLPFLITRAKGTFGTVLTTALPRSESSYVTGLSLTLQRRFRSHGQTHSYASAGCPAPQGFPGAVFPFARASFSFAGGRTLRQTLQRSCRARG
jgi:hypothetical protein